MAAEAEEMGFRVPRRPLCVPHTVRLVGEGHACPRSRDPEQLQHREPARCGSAGSVLARLKGALGASRAAGAKAAAACDPRLFARAGFGGCAQAPGSTRSWMR